MTCRELVEAVTEYLDGAMPPPERRRFEDHLRTCPACMNYLGQMRVVIRALGRLDERSIPPDARAALQSAFRGWNSAR